MYDSSTIDTLIIGGGVIGLSIARALHLRGIERITLLEKSRSGEESSWAAAGMLGPQADADEKDAFFDICSESRDLYPSFASGLLAETGVDVELDRSGSLYVAFTDEGILLEAVLIVEGHQLHVERLEIRSDGFLCAGLRMNEQLELVVENRDRFSRSGLVLNTEGLHWSR